MHTQAADHAALPPILQLKDDVEEAVIDGSLLLHSRSDLRGVRVSRSVGPLLPLLRDGVTLEQLCAIFARRSPTAQRAKLTTFLGVLQRAGLLETAGPRRDALVRYATWDLSRPLAHLGAALRASRWAAAAAFVIGLIAACALVWGASVVLPQLIELGRAAAASPPAIGVGILVVLAVIVPLHEFAHAVVAGACGVATTRIVIGRRGPWPVILCETPGSSLLADRLLRIAIPAAGPAVDLAFALLFGGFALHAHHAPAAPYLAAAACASLVAFMLDFNPYTASDGSRIIEIVIDDDHARVAAFSRRDGLRTMSTSARCYLGVTILYLVTFVCGIGSLGVSIYKGLP